jgi:cytochrome bd ubiquinol oxidase subunit I
MALLASLTTSDQLLPARLQMAFTLGFHIILACYGVGLPVLMLAAEWRSLKTGDRLWRTLAHRWSKSFAVMFAVGAVTGTVLSFEMGLLWPGFMDRWGAVIGLPFTMEGFAFFLEAIFAGIYLYGWDRLPPRVHWWTGWPIAISGFFSAFFVVTANSWMNAPAGFKLVDGKLVEIQPLVAMFNVATGAQVTHMLIAAYLVTGFSVASFYAIGLLRDPRDEYCRRGFALGMLLALVFVPFQMIVGDWSAKVVAKSQPVKLAAMEGQFQTEQGAPLRIGGFPDAARRETRYAIEIPGMLSFLSYSDFHAEVKGLNDFPPGDLPPIAVVHFAFQVMVGIGSLMALMAAVAGISYARTRTWPQSRWFLWAVGAMGPLSILAMEAGWVVTEVGRQPWIVHGFMRTSEAVTHAPGVWTVFGATIGIYAIIGVATGSVLRQLARQPIEECLHGTR